MKNNKEIINSIDEEIKNHKMIFGNTKNGMTTNMINIIKENVKNGGDFIFIDGKSEK